MVIKKSEIREAINEVFSKFGSQKEYKPYTTEDQWRDETELFMTGLKNGDFVEFGDRSIGVEWRGGGASNDPRFIVFEFGDARLRDDHFYMQHSPRLSDDQLKDIRDVMVRMGMVTKEEFDMEYGLNMDNSYYESRIDRIVRDTINEAMWTKMPEDGNFPPFKGRKPKTPKARINQIYSLVQKYGLSSKKYKDDHWQAADDYDKLFKALGYDVDWSVNDGGYGDYSEFTGRDMSKTYNIILTAEDGMQIEGYVKMCAAGSNEDPFDAYDTCMILWNKPKRRYNESKIYEVTKRVLRRVLNEDFQYANDGEGDLQLKEWAYNEAMKLVQEIDEWRICPRGCGDEQFTEGDDNNALKKDVGNGQELTVDCEYGFNVEYYESRDEFGEEDSYVGTISITSDGDMGYCCFDLEDNDPLAQMLASKVVFDTRNLDDCPYYSAWQEDEDAREAYELDRFEAGRDEY